MPFFLSSWIKYRWIFWPLKDLSLRIDNYSYLLLGCYYFIRKQWKFRIYLQYTDSFFPIRLNHGRTFWPQNGLGLLCYLFIYLLFYVAFNSQGHIAMGSLQVEETSAYCTVNHRASASNYQLSNMKCPARDSNRRPQRLEARTLTATRPSPPGLCVKAIIILHSNWNKNKLLLTQKLVHCYQKRKKNIT